MEHNLHEINRTFINLPEWMVYTNNEIIGDVVPRFIDTMKQQDPLFDAMFRRVFYGGSYYDGLKVGDPGEFDLDLLLDLPRYAQPELVDSIYPGFVQLQVNRLDAWMRQPEALPSYSNFGRLLDDNRHVNTDKVLSWMEGLVQRSLNNFVAGNSLRVTFSKSGPALTLHIVAPTTKMDVDLVPCFVFRDDKWPSGFRRNPVPSKPEFFVVPKNPKDSADVSRFWRLSFQEQERVMIDNKLTLKPTLKLLKKMRDSNNATWIPSYYIKTMFLHACLTKSESYWRRPLSDVFVDMLKEYQQYVKQGQIPYFWNEKNNLFHQKVNKKTFKNVSRWLDKAIKKIEKNPNDAQIIAKILRNNT
ncbi:cyclic GMP-AMP synthase-like receptor isoform X3 [Zophobas morio]|uniref:cyclic GMP-AMP synthase-like receptor isoform X3 n=1 Tax=Zophobas morio TaxID=2755281 RepID=UPI003082E0A7